MPFRRLPVVRKIQSRTFLSFQTLILATVVCLVAYLALVPLAFLLWTTLFDDEGFTFENFRQAYSAFDFWTMVSTSFQFASGATLLSITLGTLLAYLIVRTDVPFRTFIFVVALVPIIIPGVLHTIAWIFLLSPEIGWLNYLIEPITGPAFFNIFSMAGMILVEGLNQVPLVFLLMYGAFRSMDPSLEESALTSGARLPSVFLRVTLPLVRPALYAAILIMMVLGLEAFETPTLLGAPSGIWVFTSRIYRVLSEFPIPYGEAGAYALSLLAITSAGIFLQSRLNRRARSFQTITGKGFRPRVMSLGRLRWVAGAFVLTYFVVAVVLPVTVLVYMSFQSFYSTPTIESLSRMTLENYRYTFSDAEVLNTAWNSIVLSTGSATVVMLMMVIAAWLVVRTRLRGRWLVDNLAFLPIAVPGLVMGVALLIVYLRVPLPIYGSLLILLIAYCTRYMPYGMRFATAAIYQISNELEESAQTCGASWWETMRRVVLPLMVPGFVAGWIYIVIASVRELSSSILLYSPGDEVLGIYLWEQWEDGRVTELASAGVVLMLALSVLVLVARKLGVRIGVQDMRNA